MGVFGCDGAPAGPPSQLGWVVVRCVVGPSLNRSNTQNSKWFTLDDESQWQMEHHYVGLLQLLQVRL